MEQALIDQLPVGAAIVISLATFVLTQRRAQQIDNRAAAKDTVDILILQNKALLGDIADLRVRVTFIETQRLNCEEALARLAADHADLQAELRLAKDGA